MYVNWNWQQKSVNTYQYFLRKIFWNPLSVYENESLTDIDIWIIWI